jgi:hypothetical protein
MNQSNGAAGASLKIAVRPTEVNKAS